MILTPYISRGRLCVFGMALTDHGLVPGACGTPLVGGEDYPEGLVDLDALPEAARFEGEKVVNAVLDKIEREKVRIEAEETIERARLGDQNAVAHLVMIRENAQKGNPRAKYVHALANEYVNRHPFSPGEDAAPQRPLPGPVDRLLATITEAGEQEPQDPVGYPILLAAILPCVDVSLSTVAVLANGPPLVTSKVQAIGDAFGNEDKKQAFFAGVQGAIPPPEEMRALPPNLRRCLGAGKCVGAARRIQALRTESVPLAKVDPRLARELG